MVFRIRKHQVYFLSTVPPLVLDLAVPCFYSPGAHPVHVRQTKDQLPNPILFPENQTSLATIGKFVENSQDLKKKCDSSYIRFVTTSLHASAIHVPILALISSAIYI